MELLQKLPMELCCEIEALTHDLSPVMAELLDKYPAKFPSMVIRTKKIDYVRRLILSYGAEVHAVSFDGSSAKRMSFSVEVGYTDSLRKVRLYRYSIKPRWNRHRQRWREIRSLVQ